MTPPRTDRPDRPCAPPPTHRGGGRPGAGRRDQRGDGAAVDGAARHRPGRVQAALFYGRAARAHRRPGRPAHRAHLPGRVHPRGPQRARTSWPAPRAPRSARRPSTATLSGDGAVLQVDVTGTVLTVIPGIDAAGGQTRGRRRRTPRTMTSDPPPTHHRGVAVARRTAPRRVRGGPPGLACGVARWIAGSGVGRPRSRPRCSPSCSPP